MPAESSLAPPPSLSVGPYSIPYSLISLVTLTVQNSALAILLHYVRDPLRSVTRDARK